ncbi:TRAP transporter substrate-binding protein [Acidovorax sp. Leaf160]|uniref:TRAP transporter substrate-binding protein n=1 Tax=Acidovorax sp. Leaf160 TaxID=1736280 RepID=UPI0009E95421|nr:TRAP transporter substrate-binding protein [Acidovorax sp. Leaf160]
MRLPFFLSIPPAVRLFALCGCLALWPWVASGQDGVGSTGAPGAVAPATAAKPGAPRPRAQRNPDAPIRLRVVGGLGLVTQYTQFEEPFWTRDLSRLSGGRLVADIVPFDRAGVPGVEMLRLLQLGVVPFGTALMSSFSAQYPQYTAVDLPGLSADIASLRRASAAFRPYLEEALREEHGVEVLAVYVYPAQVVFCKKTLTRLDDLAGRRVRVSSPAQADFVAALGAEPVVTAFAQQRSSLESGDVDCAVTGAMSGNTLGLDTVASFLYPLPLNWGMAVFGANRAAWNALPADARTLLRTELGRLQEAVWAQAERETAQGIACNTGQASCRDGRKGAMVLVPVSERDDRRRLEVFRTSVLPKWRRRCAVNCDEIWERTIGAHSPSGSQAGPRAAAR